MMILSILAIFALVVTGVLIWFARHTPTQEEYNANLIALGEQTIAKNNRELDA